jgi:ABC-type Fe3+/spermidine/putrescine transport system ATPase subunit
MLALLGPSGSGKTTTLRLLAGFESPDAGRILVDGEDVTGTPPAARRFGMVFQHYALFPHLDVGRNVAFGLESLGVPSEERARRVREALEMVELAGLERRPVSALSGGQQQRVALARAMAPEPRVLLLDEPLSNLDPTLRERTRRELRALIHKIGITTVLVTHEQEEAFDLADRVAVLRAGKLEQVGTPEELYRTPQSAFVAGFIGRASVVPVDVVSHVEGRSRVRLPGATEPWEVEHTGPLSGACRLVVRPEAVRLAPASSDTLSGEVVDRRYLGAGALFTVKLASGSTVEVLAEPNAASVGSRVGLAPTGIGLHLFCGDER